MKLTEWQQYPVADGVWIYTGLYGGYFTCDICKQQRKQTHEFLFYKSVAAFESDKANNDFGRWVDNEHYGTECVKKFLERLGNLF